MEIVCGRGSVDCWFFRHGFSDLSHKLPNFVAPDEVRKRDHVMKIAKDCIVCFVYKLYIFPGTMIEEVTMENPVYMIHGSGPWPEAFLRKMEGFSAGDKISFTLKPEEGFGNHNPEAIREIPRENLDKIPGLVLETGTTLPVLDSNTGETMFGTISEIREKVILMDFNHPLSGQTLMLDGKIISVRAATVAELATGKISEVNYTDLNLGEFQA